MQLIIVCECNKNSKTDYIYIKAALERFYDITANRNVKLSPIYLNGKSNYNRREKEIKRLKTIYYDKNNTKVIFCLDKDNATSQQIIDNNEIIHYCQVKGYELVFFINDVENVFLGKQINKKDKVKSANDYARKQTIDCLKKENISCEYDLNKKGTSNLLLVFDKFLNDYKK